MLIKQTKAVKNAIHSWFDEQGIDGACTSTRPSTCDVAGDIKAFPKGTLMFGVGILHKDSVERHRLTNLTIKHIQLAHHPLVSIIPREDSGNLILCVVVPNSYN